MLQTPKSSQEGCSEATMLPGLSWACIPTREGSQRAEMVDVDDAITIKRNALECLAPNGFIFSSTQRLALRFSMAACGYWKYVSSRMFGSPSFIGLWFVEGDGDGCCRVPDLSGEALPSAFRLA